MGASTTSQFVLVDETFIATASNTRDSQFVIAPLPEAPTNWESPIAFTAGHMVLKIEVLEKPSAVPTLSAVCLKTGELVTCCPYTSYTAAGVYTGAPTFRSLWQYDKFDWKHGVERVLFVLKDDDGNPVQGNSAFYPTKVHLVVTVHAL